MEKDIYEHAPSLKTVKPEDIAIEISHLTKDYGKGELEDAKEEIIETLLNEKLNNEENIAYKTLIDIRDDYGITIEDSVINDQYENYKYNYGK